MIVAELISILEEMPPSAEVYFQRPVRKRPTVPLTEQHLDLFDEETFIIRHPDGFGQRRQGERD